MTHLGDLENEFKSVAEVGSINWLEWTPSQIEAYLNGKIDAITSVAQAKVFLKELLEWICTPIWFYVQQEVKNR